MQVRTDYLSLSLPFLVARADSICIGSDWDLFNKGKRQILIFLYLHFCHERGTRIQCVACLSRKMGGGPRDFRSGTEEVNLPVLNGWMDKTNKTGLGCMISAQEDARVIHATYLAYFSFLMFLSRELQPCYWDWAGRPVCVFRLF